MKVAIIGGSGKMGRWFARFLLKEGHEVIITGRDQEKLEEARRELGAKTATNIEATSKADAIVLSIPIDNFEAVVKQIAPYIRPGQIVIDITSIKAFPVAVMHQHIKAGLTLGIHPMFGPGASSFTNHKFVLTPTNDAEQSFAQKVKQYLEVRGAKVVVMTPEEHDEMMSVVLGLAHFIALATANTLLSLNRLKEMAEVSGTTYKMLLMLMEAVIAEDPELYASLHLWLPKVAEIEALFQDQVKAWAGLVRSGDQQQFAQRMRELKNRLKEEDPDFGKAYQNVYQLIERV